MIASDCVSTAPSCSSTGTSSAGFIPRNASLNCSPCTRSTGTYSYGRPFRFSAMRTRNDADERAAE